MRYSQWGRPTTVVLGIGVILFQLKYYSAFQIQQPIRFTTTIRTTNKPCTAHLDTTDVALEGNDSHKGGSNRSIQVIITISRCGGSNVVTYPLLSLKKLYSAYLRAIHEKPLRTKGLTAAVVNVLGDLLAQYLEASMVGVSFSPNLSRLQGFFLCGLLYIGPFVHTWYEQLWKIGRWMEDKFQSPKRTQTIVQILVDQSVGVAIFFFNLLLRL